MTKTKFFHTFIFPLAGAADFGFFSMVEDALELREAESESEKTRRIIYIWT